MRRTLFLATALGAVACNGSETQRSAPTTVEVARRDIVVDVEATGVVEPINIVEVKSKASGQITRLPVETGSEVRRGDLIVQLDTREVEAQYQQARADLDAARARRDVSAANRRRADTLFAQRVITAQEHESARLDLANAEAALIRAEAALDQAEQRRADATVRSPIDGTVLTRSVSEGQVIASATSSASGGTTLLTMADLSRVRVRVNVSEADIGSVRAGMPASIATDAYPNRPFAGVVEKIEPQALVVQSVTMFPILVSIDNRDGLLKPGMNAEVTIEIDRRPNVVAVPNDAVRMPREAMSVAAYLGISADSVRAVLASAGVNERGMGSGMGGMGGGPGVGRAMQTSRGEVALAEPQAPAQPQGAGQARQGEGRQGGPPVQVTDEQCAAVTAALTKNADAKRRIDELNAKIRSGELDRMSGMQQVQAAYRELGLDGRVAGACQRRQQGGPQQAGAAPSSGGPGGAQPAGGRPAATQASSGSVDAAQAAPAPEFGGRRRGGRTGVVFVAANGAYTTRVVQIGVANFDYTEILSGVDVGEQVALLGAIALQMQREENAERMRQRTQVPGLQREGGNTGGGGVPGGGGPRGGGPGGG